MSVAGLAQQNMDELLAEYNEQTVPYISAQQLAELSESEERLILLDARETAEYNTSHLPGAIHVGYENFDPKKLAAHNFDKNATVIVYCTVGVRSEEIGEELQELGFNKVKNLKGGIVSWKNNCLPVYNNFNQITDRVHVYGPSWQKWLENGIPTYD